MTDRRFAFAVSILLALLCGCQSRPPAKDPITPAATAAAASPSPSPAPWYEPEIRAFQAADKASPPPPGQVLFIGSSSFRLWSTLAADMSPAPVLNRGFGGSKTAEVLAVFDRIVLPYKPSVIVYYCGDNDLGTDNTNSQAAADGFLEFDRRARAQWPHIQVFYIPIKASVARWSNWPAMEKANSIVRAYCQKTPGATYLDTVTPTLTPEGRPDPTIFKNDGLHMNAKGYEIWTRVIRPPVLKAWMERSK